MKNWHGRFVACIMAPASTETDGYRGWSPCIEWCKENFGHSWFRWSYISEGVFEFQDEQDLTVFLLRWK
jgi:hypothetical protein